MPAKIGTHVPGDILMHGLITALLLLLSVCAVSPAFAQSAAPAKEPPHAMVSIYRVAAGKHADFLKWQATRDAIDKEAGVAQAQWYAHVDGDSWDYLSVGPDLTPEQNKKVEAAMKKHGLTTGFKASLEFRQFIGSHTDTSAIGPVTVSELSDWASK
jgi:hypothetical protein